MQTGQKRLLSTKSDISRHDGRFRSFIGCMDRPKRRSSGPDVARRGLRPDRDDPPRVGRPRRHHPREQARLEQLPVAGRQDDHRGGRPGLPAARRLLLRPAQRGDRPVGRGAAHLPPGRQRRPDRRRAGRRRHPVPAAGGHRHQRGAGRDVPRTAGRRHLHHQHRCLPRPQAGRLRHAGRPDPAGAPVGLVRRRRQLHRQLGELRRRHVPGRQPRAVRPHRSTSPRR